MISGQAGNAIAIYFPEEIKGVVNVQVRNLNGQMIMSQVLSKPAGHIMLQTGTNNRGMLVVSLSDGEMIQMSKTVLLQ